MGAQQHWFIENCTCWSVYVFLFEASQKSKPNSHKKICFIKVNFLASEWANMSIASIAKFTWSNLNKTYVWTQHVTKTLALTKKEDGTHWMKAIGMVPVCQASPTTHLLVNFWCRLRKNVFEHWSSSSWSSLFGRVCRFAATLWHFFASSLRETHFAWVKMRFEHWMLFQ